MAGPLLLGHACCPSFLPGDEAAVLRGHVSPELGPDACSLELTRRGDEERRIGVRPIAGAFEESFAVPPCPAVYTATVRCGRRVRRVLSFGFPREGSVRRPIHLGWVY